MVGIYRTVSSYAVRTISQEKRKSRPPRGRRLMLSVDFCRIRQHAVIRAVAQVPDDFPEADEVVVVQETRFIPSGFAHYLFDSVPGYAILESKAECAAAIISFADFAAKRYLVAYQNWIAVFVVNPPTTKVAGFPPLLGEAAF